MIHSNPIERLLDPFSSFRRAHATVGQRQLDILENAQISDQV